MSICKLPILKLANLLYITTTRVLLLLAGSALRGLLLVLPSPNNESKEEQMYELDGEMFSLEEIAEILLTDPKNISNRLSSGETLKNIVEGPSVA